MANTRSAKKQARQNQKRQQKNLARKTAIKTAIKKVMASVEKGKDIKETQELLRQAEAKLARAKGKRVLHGKTASRKISRLAKRVSAARSTQTSSK